MERGSSYYGAPTPTDHRRTGRNSNPENESLGGWISHSGAEASVGGNAAARGAVGAGVDQSEGGGSKDEVVAVAARGATGGVGVTARVGVDAAHVGGAACR